MQIKLLTLTLKNFKGLKGFKLDIGNSNANVFGDNGAGKTTLYDAFLWLMFDKDSNNKKDFSIKPFDANGEQLHYLEHEVQGEFLVDNKLLVLKKVLTEKWTKKRGQEEQEFSGHETNYWINEVPVKKSEFTAKIAEIADENIFKLITNPLYFNTAMDWKERRKILFELAGAMSDESIIKLHPQYLELANLLADRSIEDFKKVITDKLKKLNKDIDGLPLRIDELTLQLPSEPINYFSTEIALAEAKKKLADIESELSNANKASEGLRVKAIELITFKNKLDDVRRSIERETNASYNDMLNEQSRLKAQKNSLKTEINGMQSVIERNEQLKKDAEKKLVDLRKEWTDKHLEQFKANSTTCPTCKQDLPSTELDKMRDTFEANKTAKLDSINKEGKTLSQLIKDSYATAIESYVQSIEQLNKKSTTIDVRLGEIEKALKIPTADINLMDNAEYSELVNKITLLEGELEKPVEDTTTEILDNKLGIASEIEILNKVLARKEQSEEITKRIAELKAEQKELAQQVAKLEGQRYLIDQFIKTKVELLTDSINSKFTNVNFKLFDTQINGGIAECCETLVNTNGAWVPWSDANNAGKINAGLDIINTLSEYYGVNAPIFIDNRESINELIDTNSQVINLIVSKDKKLKVEVM